MELFQLHGGRWVRVVSIGIGDVMRKQSPMIAWDFGGAAKKPHIHPSQRGVSAASANGFGKAVKTEALRTLSEHLV